jgi:tripeptidyl-peptidase-1
LQVKQYMQPDPSSAKAVKSWLTQNGIHAKTSPGHGDWLTFSTTVGKANTLFNAKFETFHHADTGKKVVRSLSYSIPAHLKPHIAVAHPMVSFPNPYHGKASRASFTARVVHRAHPEAPRGLAHAALAPRWRRLVR